MAESYSSYRFKSVQFYSNSTVDSHKLKKLMKKEEWKHPHLSIAQNIE
ncbi:hypothetical protein BOVA604_1570 [Bacteroides ovatus]|nr:hypothetical protein BOVA604_1570 [Bacteroides ovatus]